jgi:hypothetical protein
MSYMASRGKNRPVSHKAVKLEEVARYLKLAKGTVSVVLNESPAAKATPQSTKDRIFAAASKLGYRANFGLLDVDYLPKVLPYSSQAPERLAGKMRRLARMAIARHTPPIV